MSSKSNSLGFTLIEVMVAILVVGIAVSALLVQMTGYTNNAGYLRDKAIAQWVALNQLELERIANRHTNILPDREKSGSAEMANREWFWQVVPIKTGADGFIQLQVSVFLEEDDKDPILTIDGYVDRFHQR